MIVLQMNAPRVEQPVWACHDCGERYGEHIPEVTTWHEMEHCDVCGQVDEPVTAGRDFGLFDPAWLRHRPRRAAGRPQFDVIDID